MPQEMNDSRLDIFKMQQLKQFRTAPRRPLATSRKDRAKSQAQPRSTKQEVISQQKAQYNPVNASKATLYRSLQGTNSPERQNSKYNLSPEVNLERNMSLIQRHLSNRKQQISSARVCSNPSNRKNTSPRQIRYISQYLSDPQPGSHKGRLPTSSQEEQQKAAIQKLLNIRCKVIRSNKSLVQSQVELGRYSKPDDRASPLMQDYAEFKTQAAAQSTICDLLMKKLHPDLIENDDRQSQFRQLVKKQSKIKQEEKRPYNNQDIYVNIRKSYKEEPQKQRKKDTRIVPSHLYKTDKQMLKIREDMFHKFTFKSKKTAKDDRIGNEESPIKGW